MANKTPQGVASQGLSSIEGLSSAIDALEKAQKAGKGVGDEFAGLNKRISSMAKESKRAKDPVLLLSKAFIKLDEAGKSTTGTVDAMTSKLEESTGILSTSSTLMLKDTIENLKKMKAELVANGKGNSREASMINAKQSKLEMERFRDDRNAMIGRAKMLQQGSEGLGGRVVGAGMGVANAAMKHGADAAEFLGDAVGLESGAMMALAATIGIVLSVLFVSNAVAKALAKSMTDMAKGGDTLNPTLQGSAKYFNEVNAAASDSMITFDKLQELMVASNKEYGRSIGLTAGFVGSIADIGVTFGLTNEESVKLAARMGVLSRTMNQTDLKRSFAEMGIQAGKLKVPMDALADPMMALAELAGTTGHSVVEASSGLDLIINSVKNLGATGKAMFQNMHGGDVAKFTKEFSSFISGMDEWTLAAMTFKENESFQQTADKVTSMGSKDRVKALKEMFNENEVTSPAERGMLMGAKNFSEANRLGSIATGVINGNMNDSQFSAALAKSLDDQLNERKTIGERIQFGQDPTAFIMDRIQKLLESILHIESVVTMFSPNKRPMTGAAVAGPSGVPASRTAMASMVHAQRPASVPVG